MRTGQVLAALEIADAKRQELDVRLLVKGTTEFFAIILAVSLNLVNGYTGQFSLGHAGFMAVGAYTSAALTQFLGPKILPSLTFLGEMGSKSAVFFCAIVAGGFMASIAGLLVGAPSLRLKVS